MMKLTSGRGLAHRPYADRVALATGARTGDIAVTNLSAQQAAAVFGVSSGDVKRARKARASNGNGHDDVQKRLAAIVAEVGVDGALSALAANEKHA